MPSPSCLAYRHRCTLPSNQSRSQVAFLALFPCATGAHCAAKFLAPVGSSLEQEVQRLAPAIAATGHHRSGPNPNFRHKPIAGEPLALLLPLPGRPLKDRYGEPERGGGVNGSR
jgi:hypothetical protein